MRSLPLLLCTLLAAVWPSTARADVLLTPFAGLSFTDGSSKGTYGASLGLGGLITLEADVARTNLGSVSRPAFDVDLHATSFMANAMVRVPVGSVQPYALAGVGLMRLAGSFSLPVEGAIGDTTRSRPAYSLGGGLIIFFSPNLGLRGDVRYLRPVGSLRVTDLVTSATPGNVPTGNLDMTRATVGLTLKF